MPAPVSRITVLDANRDPRIVWALSDPVGHVGSAQSFARPATAIQIPVNALIANSATAGSVIPLVFAGVTPDANGGSGHITSTLLSRSSSGAGNINLHLFTVAPVVANGDGGSLIVSNYSSDTYVGVISNQMTGTINGGSLANTFLPGLGLPYTLDVGEDTLWGLLQSASVLSSTSGEIFGARLTAKFDTP